MRSKSGRPWIQLIALVVVISFTVTTVAWADGSGGILATLQGSGKAADLKLAVDSIPLENPFSAIQIPAPYGVLKTNHKGLKDELVIHIQDAHVNEEAQRNIGNLIKYLHEHHGVDLVAVEGASGHMDTALFGAFPDKEAREAVADYYLEKGILTGPQHLAMTRVPEIKLFGAEQHELYESNRKAYLEALEFKDRSLRAVDQIGLRLDQISRFVFSRELRELRSESAGYEKQKSYLSPYVRYLVRTADKLNISLYPYRQISAFLNLMKLERSLDLKKAEAEIEEAAQDLKKTLRGHYQSKFLTTSIQYQRGLLEKVDYYAYLESQLNAHETLQSKYESVIDFFRYTRFYESLDIKLFKEIESLEEAVKNKLFRNPAEVKLDRLYRFHDILERLFQFSLTADDVNFFYSYRDEFKVGTFRAFIEEEAEKLNQTLSLAPSVDVINEDLSKIEEFYKAALERDEVLIDRTYRQMIESKAKTVVIVSGGFHTPGIERYLREHDVSYLVVTPKITKEIDEKGDARRYESAMQNKPSRLEKMLAEIYLPQTSNVMNDPRYQLGQPNPFFPVDQRKAAQVTREPGHLMIAGTLTRSGLDRLRHLRQEITDEYRGLGGSESEDDDYWGELFEKTEIYLPTKRSAIANPATFVPLQKKGYRNILFVEAVRAIPGEMERRARRSQLKGLGGQVHGVVSSNGMHLFYGLIPYTSVPEDTWKLSDPQVRAEVRESADAAQSVPQTVIPQPKRRLPDPLEARNRLRARAVNERREALVTFVMREPGFIGTGGSRFADWR